MSPAQWMRYSRANQNKCAGQMPLPRSLHWHKAPGSFIPLAVNRPLSRSLGRLTRLYPSYRDRRIYGPLLRQVIDAFLVCMTVSGISTCEGFRVDGATVSHQQPSLWLLSYISLWNNCHHSVNSVRKCVGWAPRLIKPITDWCTALWEEMMFRDWCLFCSSNIRNLWATCD